MTRLIVEPLNMLLTNLVTRSPSLVKLFMAVAN
jgi:hypothetical protein